MSKFSTKNPANEGDLWAAWKDHGDIAARNKIFEANMRLVHYVVGKTCKNMTREAREDMISVGNLGLMRAIDSFEPELGYKFSTYATHWIRSRVFEEMEQQRLAGQTGSTKMERRKGINLSRAEARATQEIFNETGGADNLLVESRTAQILCVSLDEMRQMKKASLQMDSLDRTLSNSQDGTTATLADMIMDEDDTGIEDRLDRMMHDERFQKAIENAMFNFSPFERQIVELRYLSDEKLTLNEVGERFGLTGERIRQLEEIALDKMSRFLRARMTPESFRLEGLPPSLCRPMSDREISHSIILEMQEGEAEKKTMELFDLEQVVSIKRYESAQAVSCPPTAEVVRREQAKEKAKVEQLGFGF